MTRPALLWPLLLLLLVAGCAVSTQDTVVVTQPVTNAQSVISGAFEEDEPDQDIDFGDLPRRIAILPMTNQTDEPAAAEVIRRTLQNHVATLNYQVMHWREVDLRLSDAGMTGAEDPATLARTLAVDGVVVGDVSDYEFFYAGVYAQIKVGVALDLRDASGAQVWQHEFDVTSRAGGVSTTAWGLLLNAALAALHLNEENLLAAADALGREVSGAFPQPPGYRGMAGPQVENVIHDGTNRTLRYGDRLQVGLKGEPGQRATAAITGVGSFDLKEGEPGVYMAELPVSVEWNVKNGELSGRLVDGSGNATRWVSPVGLINIDNTAPAPPSELQLSAHSGQAYLRWVPPEDRDVAGYRVYQREDDERLLRTESAEALVTVAAAGDFRWLRFEVSALDHAGNESEPSIVSGRSYPLPGAAEAKLADSRLAGVATESLLLSAGNSPYTLADTLVIEDGAALYVEPGVVIRASAEGSLRIRGEAHFWGGSEAVVFERLNADSIPRQYLQLDSSHTIMLEGVHFSDGGLAVDIRSGSPALKDVRMEGNAYSAMNISGSASPVVNGCVIDGSNTSGVVVEGNARPSFNGCRFTNNQPFHIQNSSAYEINAEGNEWEPAASTSSILGKVRY